MSPLETWSGLLEFLSVFMFIMAISRRENYGKTHLDTPWRFCVAKSDLAIDMPHY